MGADGSAKREGVGKMEQLIYLYGLIPTSELSSEPLPPMKGFDQEGELYPIQIGQHSAVVCKLDGSEYSEEKIKERVDQDMEWLQEKAFHHHETVMQLAKSYTTIPLKFCTLYKSEESLMKTIEDHEIKLAETFSSLKGNEEWNVKIYCDDQLLHEEVAKNNPAVEARKEEIKELPRGKQFFENKKLDKVIAEEAEAEKERVGEEVHNHLLNYVLQGTVKRNWNKDVTGKKENMTWNGVYLIPKEKVETFLEQIQDYEKKMGEKGWQFIASGPWPAYHFSQFS